MCKLIIKVSRHIQSLVGECITEIVRHSLRDAQHIGTAGLPGLPALADIEIPFFVDDMEFEPKSEAGSSPGGPGRREVNLRKKRFRPCGASVAHAGGPLPAACDGESARHREGVQLFGVSSRSGEQTCEMHHEALCRAEDWFEQSEPDDQPRCAGPRLGSNDGGAIAPRQPQVDSCISSGHHPSSRCWSLQLQTPMGRRDHGLQMQTLRRIKLRVRNAPAITLPLFPDRPRAARRLKNTIVEASIVKVR